MPATAARKRFSPARLKQARRRAGLTLRALSDALDVVEKTVWSWEVGRTLPDAAEVAHLSAVLKKPIIYFYE